MSAAYYSDICVGSIACRIEKKESGAVRVYIMTLGVLAPYRGLGTGKCSLIQLSLFKVDINFHGFLFHFDCSNFIIMASTFNFAVSASSLKN